jgi:hypothetical protein
MNNTTNSKTCFMGILSCEKYKNRRGKQDLSNSIFEYKYFVGDPTLTSPIEEDQVVYLPCKDEYEFLPIKVLLMFDWISKNKKFDYVFKTDDDIIFNFQKLQELYNFVSSNDIKYAGNFISTNPYWSDYHKDKCDDEIKNYLFLVQKCQYCSGGGYFLSNDTVQTIIEKNTDYNKITQTELLEDYFIGRFLNENGIFPTSINIQNQACFW